MGHGVLEWALAIGLLWPRSARVAGIATMAFLVLVFPANVYAAVHHVDFGGHGAGPIFLLVCAPFQAGLMAWGYWCAARRPRRESG